MSGLALVARGLGAEVSGSDRAESPFVARLREAGIEPAIGHAEANVPAGAEVVISTAIDAGNPELVAARAGGAPVIHRGDLLGEVSRLRRCIAVAGTHGKTTTTGMVAHAMLRCGREPSFLIGGELRSAGTNAAWGGGDWVVVEADESDRSFLKLRPDVAVVTNVELDHHSSYASLAALEGAFADFLRPAECALLGPGVKLEPEGRRVTFGIDSGELRAERLELAGPGSRFVVDGVAAELPVPGRHNVLNALAALAACREAGLEPAQAAPALADFSGAGRRFEPRGQTATGAHVYDDYAHHPTEVRATLEAARALEPRRLVACFQPHLFSRTRALAREFGRALALADVIAVLDVYPARERAEDFPGVSGLLVARAAADAAGGRRVYWLPRVEDAGPVLEAELREGDLLLTLGAGDVDRVADRLTGSERPAAPAAALR